MLKGLSNSVLFFCVNQKIMLATTILKEKEALLNHFFNLSFYVNYSRNIPAMLRSI
jgi:hypothetical protein